MKSFYNETQKILARGSTNLCKLIQRSFKQNIMLSNESGAKSKTDRKKAAAPKSNPAWYEKIDSILGDTNTDLNELVSISLDTSYSQEVIQNDNENESLEDNADDDSDKDLYNDSEDDHESNNANKEDKVENVSANKKKAILEKEKKGRAVTD